MGEKFDLGKSSLHDSFKRIINSINNVADSFIKWPTQNEIYDIKHKFSQIGPLPDVIGAIDGTHIPIKAPMVVTVLKNSIFIYNVTFVAFQLILIY